VPIIRFGPNKFLLPIPAILAPPFLVFVAAVVHESGKLQVGDRVLCHPGTLPDFALFLFITIPEFPRRDFDKINVITL
jgi:hypothetical protein